MENIFKKFFIKNGRKYSCYVTEEILEFAINYKPKNEDILLVSYPKTGRIWTTEIIKMILNETPLFDSWIEVNGVSAQNTLLTTHLPYDLVPKNSLAKYLYVFRNPKDTVVSLFHHLKEHQYFDESIEFKQFFNDWICGHYYDYFADVSEYWRHRMDGKSDYLVYEQMKRNPNEGVLKIANFLGKEFVKKLLANNGLVLNEVLNKTSFEFMKNNNNLYSNTKQRKGIVGDWRSHLTRDESDLIDQKFTQYFSGTELESIWREDMKWR